MPRHPIVLLVCAYLSIFITLDLMGAWYFTQSGTLRDSGGTCLAVTDQLIWQPALCYYQPNFRDIEGHSVTRADLPGYLFAPLIAADRYFVHPIRPLAPIAAEARGVAPSRY